MSQFSELLKEAADAEQYKLSSVLLKAKVFAARVKGRKLRQWIDLELMGYKDGRAVPNYRIVHPVHFGDFAGPFHSAVKNVPLSTENFEPEIREGFDCNRIVDNVGALEGFIESESEHYYLFWPPLFIELFRRKGPRISGYILNHAQSVIGKPAIQAVLSAIRTRLVDLLLELAEKYPELEDRDEAVKETQPTEIDDLTERIVFQGCTFGGDALMGDKYVAGQAGAMGPGATAHHMRFEQLWSQESQDLKAVAEELSRLRTAMRSQATETEHDEAVAEVAKAEEAAKNGDGATMMERLSHVGHWGLKTATEVGVALAAHLITKAMTGGQ